MAKRTTCLFCLRNVGEVRLVVNVAKEFAHEAPAGVFHTKADPTNCFDKAVADHRRKLGDAEVVIGEE